MNDPVVYFTDRNADSQYNMLDKIEQVFEKLGLKKAIKKGHRVQVKTHFGNWGNTNYIRPVYVRKVVDLIREAGGHPFVTETCGLGYGPGGIYGGRTTAPEYLGMAVLNGFTQSTVGAPILMADGYWGTDTHRVKIKGKYVKNVDVAAAVLDSDIVIMLTHAKGHGLSGLGGSLKNLGIGLVGKSGKAAMHFISNITVDAEKCKGPDCSMCLRVCPVRCISMDDVAIIDTKKCIGCGHCRDVCTNHVKAKAISIGWRPNQEQSVRFVENAKGVVDSIGRDHFYYINLALDISDKCDCWNVGAPLLVHDIGIFGSRDPVAIDQATMDAVSQATPNPSSAACDCEPGEDKFAVAHKHRDKDTGEYLHFTEDQLSHAEKIGLGNRKYKLVTLQKEKK